MADLIVRVVTIDEIKTHPNADRLDLAVVGGWQCVVGRDNWHTGDKCVYFPPDCMLPEERCQEFEIENYVSRSDRFPGMGRIRCARLRGETSFGLVVSVDPAMPTDLYENCAEWYGAQKYEPLMRTQVVGRKMYGHVDNPETIICSQCIPGDQRDYNEIQKRERRGLTCTVCGYTPPIASYAAPEHAGFPKYTDIQNLRHFPDIFEDGEVIVATEKIHGANCRIGVVKTGTLPLTGFPIYEEMSGSHNVRRADPGENSDHPDQAHRSDTYWFPWTIPGVRNFITAEAQKHNSVVVYGEVYGPGIQTLSYGLDGLGFAAFDIKIDGKYLPYPEFTATCEENNIPIVPLLDVFSWNSLGMNHCRKLAKGQTMLGADHIREGIVLKPTVERMDPKIGRVALKLVSDEYLLSKHHEEEQLDDSEAAIAAEPKTAE